MGEATGSPAFICGSRARGGREAGGNERGLAAALLAANKFTGFATSFYFRLKNKMIHTMVVGPGGLDGWWGRKKPEGGRGRSRRGLAAAGAPRLTPSGLRWVGAGRGGVGEEAGRAGGAER